MTRRLFLALLPIAGFALGAALAPFGGSAAATAPAIPGGALAAGILGCLALAGLAAALSAPRRPRPHRQRRGEPAIPRSTPLAAHRAEPPTVSGYWRAHDQPDWPEGEVRRERVSEEEPVGEGR